MSEIDTDKQTGATRKGKYMRVKRTILIEAETLKDLEAKAKRDGVSVNKLIDKFCSCGLNLAKFGQGSPPVRAIERLHRERGCCSPDWTTHPLPPRLMAKDGNG